MRDQEFKQQQLCRQDVQILVTQLLKSEEATIKLIIERLYDTGTTNFINQKVKFVPVNRGLKILTRYGKPAGRFFGYRWLVQKTPRLITGWLFRQVAFQPKQKVVVQQTIDVPAQSQTLLLDQQLKIKQLQSRLRLTSGVAALSFVSMGGLLLWQNVETLTQLLPNASAQIPQSQPFEHKLSKE